MLRTDLTETATGDGTPVWFCAGCGKNFLEWHEALTHEHHRPSAVDRAAEIVAHTPPPAGCVNNCHEWPICGHQVRADMQALADAGRLVTDEIQAVLDAVLARRAALSVPIPLDRAPESEWLAWTRTQAEATARYHEAVDAYLASRPDISS